MPAGTCAVCVKLAKDFHVLHDCAASHSHNQTTLRSGKLASAMDFWTSRTAPRHCGPGTEIRTEKLSQLTLQSSTIKCGPSRALVYHDWPICANLCSNMGKRKFNIPIKPHCQGHCKSVYMRFFIICNCTSPIELFTRISVWLKHKLI